MGVRTQKKNISSSVQLSSTRLYQEGRRERERARRPADRVSRIVCCNNKPDGTPRAKGINK